MPLLNSTPKKTKRASLNILLDESLMSEIKAYCSWAHIDKPPEFILQAVQYVLKNDKEWRKVFLQGNQENTEELKK